MVMKIINVMFMTSLTDQQLIDVMARGGLEAKAAFSEFYSRFATKVKNDLIYFEGVALDDVEDVFQDTCLKVIQSSGSYAGGSVLAWVKRIARNVATDYWRRQGKIRSFSEGEEEQLISGFELEEVVSGSVDDCVEKSLLRFREAYPDRYYALSAQLDGLSVSQIGDLLDRTVAATKEFISQSKKKLAPFLDGCHAMVEG